VYTQYTLLVEDVFAVQRAGESERYINKYKDLDNKQLLWHGTGVYIGERKSVLR
jgi:hypothetical protein